MKIILSFRRPNIKDIEKLLLGNRAEFHRNGLGAITVAYLNEFKKYESPALPKDSLFASAVLHIYEGSIYYLIPKELLLYRDGGTFSSDLLESRFHTDYLFFNDVLSLMGKYGPSGALLRLGWLPLSLNYEIIFRNSRFFILSSLITKL